MLMSEHSKQSVYKGSIKVVSSWTEENRSVQLLKVLYLNFSISSDNSTCDFYLWKVTMRLATCG